MLRDLCQRSLSLLSDIVTEVIGIDLLTGALLADQGLSSSSRLLSGFIFHFFIVLCEALLLSK